MEVESDLDRLRGALRRATPGDARRVRGMLGELVEARRRLRESVTLQADLRAVTELTGVEGPEARAVALRLRGHPWREVLRGLPRVVAAAVRAAWGTLYAALGSGPRGTGRGQATQPVAENPGGSGSRLERWVGRARDAERALRLFDVFRRAGLVPGGSRAEVVFRHARPRIASAYVLVQVPAPLADVWGALRRCGLRVLGPAPAGV